MIGEFLLGAGKSRSAKRGGGGGQLCFPFAPLSFKDGVTGVPCLSQRMQLFASKTRAHSQPASHGPKLRPDELSNANLLPVCKKTVLCVLTATALARRHLVVDAQPLFGEEGQKDRTLLAPRQVNATGVCLHEYTDKLMWLACVLD